MIFKMAFPSLTCLLGEDDSSRSIVISEMLATKYTLHVSGFAEKKAIAVEIDNVETGVKRNLFQLLRALHML